MISFIGMAGEAFSEHFTRTIKHLTLDGILEWLLMLWVFLSLSLSQASTHVKYEALLLQSFESRFL
jgi:predicted Kef-type K+ transport protein